ncbi:MAG: NIPSNAP family protein [Candidatus Tectomicrobia bacterium]|uniref:NIPSNAP family protein n=1 Tax=Tectimicrobiota bacterium TaxID=2528274 RepID=A0A932I2H0_UNCTE|nr:NIPSNAP family protein [Candidatus Tectomicrobia bacterium]
MLYEVRAYTITPGHVEEAVEDFGRIIERRVRLSPLVGFFQCAMGEMNRILHIWEYESTAHRESVRAETLRQPWWPPLKREHIHKQVTRLMRPSSCRPRPLTGAMGGIYVIHSDFLKTGAFKEAGEAWKKLLPERERLSPLAGAFGNPAGEFESGILNEFVHIWPYRDLAHWAEVREREAALPGWRESLHPFIVSQTAEAWLPAPYSPMH